MRLIGDEAEAFFRAEGCFYNLGELVVHIGAENEIDVGIAFIYLLPAVRLLSHTAAKTDFYASVALFSALELSRLGKRANFGVLADSAGVDNYHLRVIGVVRDLVAAKLQCAHYTLAVVFVLLTAEGDNARLFARRFASQRKGYFILTLYFALWNKNTVH